MEVWTNLQLIKFLTGKSKKYVHIVYVNTYHNLRRLQLYISPLVLTAHLDKT